jgi:4-carboxymuconolactone decarboxylase
MDDKERHERGMAVRRAVLGEAHVNRALQHTNDFNRDFQDFITRYAWGEIWARPGLERRERSLITLAVLVALGKDEEFQMHVRAAINNGVTRDQIKELIMHTGIYCGMPSARGAFRIAQTTFTAMDADRAP